MGFLESMLGQFEYGEDGGDRKSPEYQTGKIEKPRLILEHGTKAQIIAKLERDFGEEEVKKAIKDHGYKKAIEVARHFGTPDTRMSKTDRVVNAYLRLTNEEQEEFKGKINEN